MTPPQDPVDAFWAKHGPRIKEHENHVSRPRVDPGGTITFICDTCHGHPIVTTPTSEAAEYLIRAPGTQETASLLAQVLEAARSITGCPHANAAALLLHAARQITARHADAGGSWALTEALADTLDRHNAEREAAQRRAAPPPGYA